MDRSQEHIETRRSVDALILSQLTALGKTVNDNHAEVIKEIGTIRADLRVHVAEDEAVADDVKDHSDRFKEIDKLKSRGFILASAALLGSGALGAWGKDVLNTIKGLFQ